MAEYKNPFVYDAAHTLDREQIAEYYVDDHNYSRLIKSKRNVFLQGERGSGKSMALLYNALAVQRLLSDTDGDEASLEFVGAVVPCNTPLTQSSEYELMEEGQARNISEHFLVLALLFEINKELAEVDSLLNEGDEEQLRDELEFVLEIELPDEPGVFEALQNWAQRESRRTQEWLNSSQPDDIYERARSFGAFIIPFMRLVRKIPRLSSTHFLLMIDDAHELNEYQVRAMNSWVAYRDRSLFSIKVATAKIGRPESVTSSGGAILEGHDYITVDLEKPYHSKESSFGQLAKKIVERRLEGVGIEKSPFEFFPTDEGLQEELEAAKERVRKEAREKYPEDEKKKIRDYVYKRERAEYFRSRSDQANLPAYSGFEMLVYLSTGIIRNLLRPCWYMYDDVISGLPEEDRSAENIPKIPANIQAKQIKARSERAWERLQQLDRTIDNCSTAQSEKVYNLFNELAVYFKKRLLYHDSEPGAISFTISESDSAAMRQLEPLLLISQKARMLYVREGAAKEAGKREPYYVPNRMLWPNRGLDPHGQNARASIRASALLEAAHGEAIPTPFADTDDSQASFL